MKTSKHPGGYPFLRPAGILHVLEIDVVNHAVAENAQGNTAILKKAALLYASGRVSQ